MALALKDKKIFPLISVSDKQGASDNNIHFAVNCRHCVEPYCVKSCISGALSIVDGVIRLDQDKCIGCYTCILSCPYGCISPASEDSPFGHVVQKCELCLRTVEGEPQCVKHCPNAAIVFEDRG
jgi:carbon-monoxide dehydrogenase iron sulfur subunit